MSPRVIRCAAAFACALVALVAFACQRDGDSTVPAPAEPEASASPPAAEIGGVTISMDELDDFIRDRLFEQQTRDPMDAYEMRAHFVERLIDTRVVETAAAAEGLTIDEYLDQAVDAKGEVTEEEIQAFWDKNRDRIPEKATLEDAREGIISKLRGQRGIELVKELRTAANATVLLEPHRLEIAAVGPSKGPAEAPVTIVEFSDFQCPFCKRVAPTMQQILDEYPEQVRVVYRHHPLDRIHPRARPAAHAAYCADAQGRFWDFHDLVFENNRKLSDEDLEKYADEAGVELEGYRACIADAATHDAVEADAQAAADAGLTGTPAFLVNGIPLKGAKSFPEFVKIIDAELRRAGVADTQG